MGEPFEYKPGDRVVLNGTWSIQLDTIDGTKFELQHFSDGNFIVASPAQPPLVLKPKRKLTLS